MNNALGRSGHERKLMMWLVALSAIAVGVGCSSSRTESETPTATAITSIANQNPPGLLRIWRVEDFGAPVADTVFEVMLERLPDNSATRRYTKLSDFAGTLKVLGLERVPPGSDPETRDKFLYEMIGTEIGGFGGLFPAWPADMGDYFSEIHSYPYVAFDFLSVDQFATASNQFRGATRQADEIRLVYDIAFGQFDPDATTNARLKCECDQPDIRVHNGVEFLAWDEENVTNLRRRLEPPLYDDLGRGPRLFIRDGEAYWTIHDREMEDLIDVLTGARKSIVDDDGYMAAVRWLSALGTMRDITLMSGGFSVEEVESPTGSELFEESVKEARLLHPFEFVAFGTGFDGERRDLRWRAAADVAEFDVVDNLLIARIYFTDVHPRQDLIGLSIRSLIVHE